ncbi:MAG: efflux transporter outer membrane subunit [Elusimicrobiaceae bacterium]|nr:efflux transporter outer membrane subunit [Elusimicrobiaceae bacterium]
MKYRKAGFLFLILSLLSGCMLGPSYKRPDLDLPAGQPADRFGVFTTQSWWRVFEDPVLDSLEQEALSYNQDLKAAMARVDEARADVNLARADQMPSLSASLQGGRENNNAAGLPGSGTQNPGHAAVSMSFELDLWGKYRRLSQAAKARLLASEAAQDTVRLTLTADVANQYFTLRMLDEQLIILQQTLQAREENVRIYEARYKSGYCTEVDLRRVQADKESVQAQMQQLALQREQTETALAVLLGQSPREIIAQNIPRGKTLRELNLVPDVPENLPSDLLERRPDIRSAEEQLIAANADVGAARAAYFPSISLTGAAGFASNSLSHLFTGGAGIWSLAGEAMAPIFEGGKIRAQNKKAEATYREQLAVYTKTVQTAFQEAYDALTANRLDRDIFDSYQAQTEAMQRSYELTKKQEDAGLIGVTDLLNVEENLLSAEMNLATARKNELSAVVNLCKALGGGWQIGQNE